MKYQKLKTVADFPFLHDNMCIAADIETTGLSPHLNSIVNCAFYCGEDVVYYTDDVEVMRGIFCFPTVKFIFHNAVFDVSFLKHHGCPITAQIHDTMVLAHVLDCNDPMSLKEQAVKYLGDTSIERAKKLWVWLKENKLTKKDITKAPDEILIPYVCEDVINTYRLFAIYQERAHKLGGWTKKFIKRTPWEYYIAEGCNLIPVLVDMYLRGVSVDLNRASTKKFSLVKLQNELIHQLDSETKDITQIVREKLHKEKTARKLAKSKTGKLKKDLPPIVFNWNSSDHLRCLFFDVLKTKKGKMTASGKPSVDGDFLRMKSSQFPWLNNLLEYRRISKILGTYVSPLFALSVSNRIHANILITGTETGRFSCKNPNLQNIPRPPKDAELDHPLDIKSLYRAGEGKIFIYGDYSQIELRIAAHLSKDKLLIQAYNEGLDLHQMTADTINEKYNINATRNHGKTLNFSIIYNASGFRVAEILGLMERAEQHREACDCASRKTPLWDDCPYHKKVKEIAREGDDIRHLLFGKYKGLKAYLDKQIRFMTHYHANLSDFGRIRRLPDLKLDPRANSQSRKKYNHAVKAGFNHRDQSDAASICKRAMVKLHAEGFHLINQIHDALLSEEDVDKAPELMVKMKHTMENVVKLRVPLVVEPKLLNSFNEADTYD